MMSDSVRRASSRSRPRISWSVASSSSSVMRASVTPRKKPGQSSIMTAEVCVRGDDPASAVASGADTVCRGPHRTVRPSTAARGRREPRRGVVHAGGPLPAGGGNRAPHRGAGPGAAAVRPRPPRPRPRWRPRGVRLRLRRLAAGRVRPRAGPPRDAAGEARRRAPARAQRRAGRDVGDGQPARRGRRMGSAASPGTGTARHRVSTGRPMPCATPTWPAPTPAAARSRWSATTRTPSPRRSPARPSSRWPTWPSRSCTRPTRRTSSTSGCTRSSCPGPAGCGRR